MGLPRFIRAPGVPYRELITHARYSERQDAGASASFYYYSNPTSTTVSTIITRPFTVTKPGWVFIVALCFVSDYTNKTPAQYWVYLYRDNNLLDSYTWSQTTTGQHNTRRVVLYGWEYLTPGDYTAYIKGKSNYGSNYLKLLSAFYPGGGSFPGIWFPYLISVNYVGTR